MGRGPNYVPAGIVVSSQSHRPGAHVGTQRGVPHRWTEFDPGVHIQRHLDTISFVFDDVVLLRIKKANLELKTSNYPTELAGLFYQHQTDLFGFPGVQRVEAAYVLNRFETEVDWVGIVAWNAHRQLWHFELPEPQTVTPISSLQQPLRRPTSQLAKPKPAEAAKEVRTTSDYGER